MMLITLLRTYREKMGLSLRDLSKLTGIHYVTLHRLELGRAIHHREWARLWQWLLKEEGK
jgi:transcriptional regulator with XRE-family HTH domain